MGKVGKAIGNVGKGIGEGVLNIGTLGMYGQMQGAARTAKAATEGARIQAENERFMQQAKFDEAGRQQKRAVAAAEPSVEELKSLRDNIAMMERATSRTESMLDAINPAFMENARQSVALLQGKEAPILDPVRKARERGRINLTNRLRQQLGTGFETSSAGIESLNRYDTETEGLLAQAQQSAIAQMMGVNLQAQGQLGLPESRLAQAYSIPTAQAGRIRERQLNAILNTDPTAEAGIPMSGMNFDFVGDMVRGQGEMSRGKQFTELTTTVGTALAGDMFKPKV